VEPPDPIPNSEVKRGSADDTAVSGRGKVGRRLNFFLSGCVKIFKIISSIQG